MAQVQIGDWLDNGGGVHVEAFKQTDPIECLRTMFLLNLGDQPQTDLHLKDVPENTVYFKCSGTLLGRVIRTLEAQRDATGRSG